MPANWYICEKEGKTERFRAFTQHSVLYSHWYDQVKAHHQFDPLEANADDGTFSKFIERWFVE